MLNDGTIGENVTDYTYGTAVTLPVPTKNGYKFEGWYDNAEFASVTSCYKFLRRQQEMRNILCKMGSRGNIPLHFNTDGGAFGRNTFQDLIWNSTSITGADEMAIV